MNTDIFKVIRSGDVVLLRTGISEARWNLDERDDFGRTPIMEATLKDKEEMVKLLLTGGADPNLKDKSGYSCLHYAAQEYRCEIGRMLLNEGAEVDSVDGHGNTPLFRAVFESRGRGDMIRLLLEAGADRRKVNTHGVSPEDLAKGIANFDVRRFFD